MFFNNIYRLTFFISNHLLESLSTHVLKCIFWGSSFNVHQSTVNSVHYYFLKASLMYIHLSQSLKQIITSSIKRKKNIAHVYLFKNNLFALIQTTTHQLGTTHRGTTCFYQGFPGIWQFFLEESRASHHGSK